METAVPCMVSVVIQVLTAVLDANLEIA